MKAEQTICRRINLVASTTVACPSERSEDVEIAGLRGKDQNRTVSRGHLPEGSVTLACVALGSSPFCFLTRLANLHMARGSSYGAKGGSGPIRRPLRELPRRSLPTDAGRSLPLDWIPPSPSTSRGRGLGRQNEDEEYLSADEATRRMLEKWDFLDSNRQSASSNDRPPGRDRDRRQPTRSSSVPSAGTGRRKSRVREWEQWRPEMERIRLAQVEMERRLDEEAQAHQLASVEGDRRESERSRTEQKKVRERKSTPRYPAARGTLSDADTERSSPAISVDSTKADCEGSDLETTSTERNSRQSWRKKQTTVRTQCEFSSTELFRGRADPELLFTAMRPPSRRSQNREASTNPPVESRSRASKVRIERRSDSHSPHSCAEPIPVSSRLNTRKSQSRAKPAATQSGGPRYSRNRSAPPQELETSPRQSRADRHREKSNPRDSPNSDSRRARDPPVETDLLATATQAAEQVASTVTSAFNRVLPSLFGSRK